MLILSDIITISFSLYLKGNITYKYTTNVHTLQTSLLCPKVWICLSIKWNLFWSTVATVTVRLYISNDSHGWQWKLSSWQSITITEPQQLTTEPRLLLNAENISSETANIPVLGLPSCGHSLPSASVFICISKHWNSMELPA